MKLENSQQSGLQVKSLLTQERGLKLGQMMDRQAGRKSLLTQERGLKHPHARGERAGGWSLLTQERGLKPCTANHYQEMGSRSSRRSVG